MYLDQIRAGTTRPLGEHPRQVSKKPNKWSWRPSGGHISPWTAIVFIETHLGVERNQYKKFHGNSSIDYGSNVITSKMQDGQQHPHLSIDWNQIWECTTRSFGEHPRQCLKKSDQRSWRRCGNETVTVLTKGKVVISKMVACQTYK